MKRATLFERTGEKTVRCLACAHGCTIKEGKRGICGVHENRGGVLWSLVYGKAIAVHVDPIEKKPLFHFLPGSRSLSVATVGCNMTCLNCQNFTISQMPREEGRIEGSPWPPDRIVADALESGCSSVSYTYTEPAVFWDYARDTSEIARTNGLKNVFVTNGYFSEKSLEAIGPFMDAANVDLKSFRDRTYLKHCGARLEPVLHTIRRMKEMKIWVEVTTLLIPGLNDSDAELEDTATFLVSVDKGIPWHISRFHPSYRMLDRPMTPAASLCRASDIGKSRGIKHLYLGNMPGVEGENTFCDRCHALLVRRSGFEVEENRLLDGLCPDCKNPIDGVWS